MKWKFCASCAKQLQSEWNYCAACGVPIGLIAINGAANVPTVSTIPFPAQTSPRYTIVPNNIGGNWCFTLEGPR